MRTRGHNGVPSVATNALTPAEMGDRDRHPHMEVGDRDRQPHRDPLHSHRPVTRWDVGDRWPY